MKVIFIKVYPPIPFRILKAIGLMERSDTTETESSEDQIATIKYLRKDGSLSFPLVERNVTSDERGRYVSNVKERVIRVERSTFNKLRGGKNNCVWIPIRYPVIKSCICSC